MYARAANGALRKGALFVCALFLLAPWFDAAADAGSALVQVERALDGDSLQLADGRQVRLIGINTPEFGKDGAPNQLLAAEARNHLNTLVQGGNVQLVFDKERFDRYRRTLAYAQLADGRDVQLLLLRAGLAWFVAIPPNVARIAAYRAAEAEARAARRGIWALADYEPLRAERLSRARTGFVRLSGTVTAVRARQQGTELMLAPRVWIFVPRTKDFANFPLPAPGKRVLARGWLAEYKDGIRLRLTHPAMLDAYP